MLRNTSCGFIQSIQHTAISVNQTSCTGYSTHTYKLHCDRTQIVQPRTASKMISQGHGTVAAHCCQCGSTYDGLLTVCGRHGLAFSGSPLSATIRTFTKAAVGPIAVETNTVCANLDENNTGLYRNTPRVFRPHNTEEVSWPIFVL